MLVTINFFPDVASKGTDACQCIYPETFVTTAYMSNLSTFCVGTKQFMYSCLVAVANPPSGPTRSLDVDHKKEDILH